MIKHTSTIARLSAVALAAGLITAVAGCTDTAPTNAGSPPAVTNPSDAPTDSGTPHEGIGMEQAGTIATERFGGTVSSIEDDSYKGEPAWEVEIKDSAQGRIEVKVSKATGDILEVEQY